MNHAQTNLSAPGGVVVLAGRREQACPTVGRAADLAARTGATLHLVAVYAPGERAGVEDRLVCAADDARLGRGDLEVCLHPRQGDPAEALRGVARDEGAVIVAAE